MRSTPSRPSRWLALPALLFVCAALVAGCGSTASRAARLRAQQGAGGLEGLSGPDAGTTASGPAGSVDTGAAAVASGGAGGASSGRTGTATAAGGQSATAAVQAGAPVQIGLFADNPQSTNTYIGTIAPGLKQGDNAAAMQAVVRYINSHGGLASHPIQPVVHLMDINSGNYPSEYQKGCADFTQDHHVFAVVGTIMFAGWDTLATCLANAKVPYITETAPAMLDQTDVDRFAPYLYAPGALGGNRWGVLVDQLAAAGFFNPSAKVGVFYTDEPVGIRTAAVVKARLAQIGHPSVAEASTTVNHSTAEIANKAGPTQNAILRFRGAGVDHVVCVDTLGACPVFFMTEAEQQGYRPRYAVTSMDNLGLAVNVAPKAQLQNTFASSWMPPYDVSQAQMPALNPAFQLCMQLTKGITSASNGSQSLASGCNGLFFLQTVANRAGQLSPAAMRSAADGLGSAFVSPMIWSTGFGPGRSDGASSVGLLVWNAGCTCFAYQGAPTPAP